MHMRTPVMVHLLLIFLLCTQSACFPGSIKKYRNIYLDKDTAISLSDHPTNEIQVLYTGCGGMVIHADSFSVLIDPFYSYSGLSIIRKKLATDREQVNRVCDQIDNRCGGTGKIGAVLIAHAHYDHLSDLPYMMNSRLKHQQMDIIGCSSVRNALANIPLPPYRFYEPRFSPGRCYDTFGLNGQIKLTVIPSDHAPHIKLLGGNIKLMNGPIGPKGVKGFDTSGYKAWFFDWKEGEDYSFLIEVKKGITQKPLRIFIQSSSCRPPAGIPPVAMLTDSIDLAFIGVASANYVRDYPESLLKAIKPKYVVLVHWEDFFRPYAKSPKIVRATNFKTFLSGYKKAMGPGYALRTSMPRQLTRYTFAY